MSRNLHTSSSRPSLKTPTTPVKARIAAPTTPARIRTQSTKSTTSSKAPSHATAPAQDSAPPPLSIKEAIALRRAEAKKAQERVKRKDSASMEDASPSPPHKPEEDDILGRLPVRETIERARSTGNLNLATRSLPCIPSALFEIHLGITPVPLKSVPHEPALPASASADVPRRGKRDAPAWFEAQDLQVLKVWNNEIEEIQHEISLFGSLKVVDLHTNRLASLPATFADLAALTTLDLSHNCLTSLPANIFALPDLSNLNISHNSLSTLPFNAPFASSTNGAKKQTTGGSFFTPTITRATSPLPRLLFLDASHNKISAKSIDLQIPKTLIKMDLSANPLGVDGPECRSLLQVLGNLPKLKDLRFESADISDDVFPPTLFPSSPFPNIRVLDLGQTKVTPGAVKEALRAMKQRLDFDVTTEDPAEGVACIIVGKRIIKEAWEIELERREKTRKANLADFDDWGAQPASTQTNRGASAKSTATHVVASGRLAVASKPREVVKEAWELEAEQGLLTEGGKRRARAAAAAAAAATPTESKPQFDLGVRGPSAATRPTSPSGSSLASPQYYSKLTQTLTLPPSSPPSKAPAHSRAFSMSVSSFSAAPSARSTDLAVPSPTLPLSAIVSQPFAHTLKTLILVNRRLDKSFLIPTDGQGFLPLLEELDLEGCGLADLVSVTRSDANAGEVTPPRSTVKILPLIAKLFPSLLTLNLSGNTLSNAAFTADALSELILATPERRGLKHLRIRGNRISELEGFHVLAESFKGNRQVPGWRLDELDIRDNEIGKLPPEMGLLPMDVFLVDGNTFRVPPRRVWEREGTKGLLSWLRGRIE